MSYTPTKPVTAEQVAAIRKVANRKGYNLDRWVRVSSGPDGAQVDICERVKSDTDDVVSASGDILREIKITALGGPTVYNREGDRDFNETPVRYVASEQMYGFADGSTSVLRSLANVLRKGDELRVKFVIANSTQTLKDNGLQQDECYVSVVRNGKYFATFCVDMRVIPIGGLASMRDNFYRPAAAV